MRIRGIKTFRFSVPTGQARRAAHTGKPYTPHKTWLLVKVETDTEISGWGEATGEWLAPLVEPTLHELSRLLVDRDPLAVAALTQDLCDRLPWKGGPVLGTAIAGINMALYDIAGKAWGVPVHTILGGKRRDRIRVYCSGGLTFTSPEEAAERATQHAARGYAGIKGSPLESRRWPMDTGAIEHCVQCIATAREAVGPGLDLFLDTHGSPTPELSIEFAKRAAVYRPVFLEEPVKVGSIDALMDVTRKSPIPIATGEKIFTLRDFALLIERRACAYLQPDITHCFGITTLMAIARQAEHNQMLIAPHNVAGPVGTAATLNADAAIPNFLIQEMIPVFFDQFGRYAEHDWTIQDGCINVSDRPGLGVEVKEADLARLPCEPMAYREYRHEDGSWKGW